MHVLPCSVQNEHLKNLFLFVLLSLWWMVPDSVPEYYSGTLKVHPMGRGLSVLILYHPPYMKWFKDKENLNHWTVTLCSEIPKQALVDQCSSEYISPLWSNPEQGVYEFPRLTLLGFDTNEPQVKRLTQLGLKVLPFCTTPYHLVVRMNLFGSTPFKTHFLNSFLHKLLWILDCHLSFRCHKPLTAGTSCDQMTKTVTKFHCLSLAATIGHPVDMIQLL